VRAKRGAPLEYLGSARYRPLSSSDMPETLRLGQVASGDRHSSSTRDFGPESNASAGHFYCWTATDREAAAHTKRGRRGRRHAKHAHKIGREANGGHGAALHRPPGVAMRSCGQSGSTRADVLLHAGQIRNRHDD
jgi:hypothetical protein